MVNIIKIMLNRLSSEDGDIGLCLLKIDKYYIILRCFEDSKKSENIIFEYLNVTPDCVIEYHTNKNRFMFLFRYEERLLELFKRIFGDGF